MLEKVVSNNWTSYLSDEAYPLELPNKSSVRSASIDHYRNIKVVGLTGSKYVFLQLCQSTQ